MNTIQISAFIMSPIKSMLRHSMFQVINNFNWGTIKFKNGNVYEGEIMFGNLHGKGKMIFTDGVVYKGDFHLNELIGEASKFHL